ncbi:META domain-containing protein [Sphingomonas sp.]|uniref:META domain-containing protein n=1 Tax=Sphingomonas sp. TaxID=28214 RepID=UPI0017ED7E29|nr:META domain-containing protein [Sphingomonas sp.]MBA3511583.1 META domain-containing protein [Sphingomonas sp.]
MDRILWLIAILAAGSCEASNTPVLPVTPPLATAGAADDGTFLQRIDPLGGQWSVERIGGEDFQRFKAWINFSAGGFLNHGAGCSGAYPAFYRLHGRRLTIIRREDVRVGKCGSGAPATAAAAAASERRLAEVLDHATAWEKPNDRTLILTAEDGTRAVLTRPVEPHPDLAGRWIIETISGEAFVTGRRPPILTISMRSIGVVADCNRIGARFTTPAPGRIAVTTPAVGTEKGCDPEDSAEDALMTKAMISATAYRFKSGRLIFIGGPGMVLRRPSAPNRRLAGEYESCGNTLLGAYHEGPITLAINERTMRDNAGCTAEYSAEGPELNLRLANNPACAAKAPPFVPGEPVSVGGMISTLAVTRPDGFGFNDEGQLILRTNRGLLMMCRKGSPTPFGG